MKKLYSFILLLASTCSFSQAPAFFNYQGVARNSSGNPIANQQVGVRATIIDSSSSGGYPIFYETHTPTTNQFGLFTLAIGSGTAGVNSVSLQFINWGENSKFLKIEFDPTGGTNYVLSGITQLMSVPFALYAANNGDTSMWRKNANIPNNIYYSGGTVDVGDVTNLSLLVPDHAVRAISLQNSAVYGESQSYTSAGITGYANNVSNAQQVGVTGSYNGGGYGAGVAGIGYNGSAAPAGVDIGVYGSAGSTAIAVYSNGSIKITDGTEGAGKVLTSDANGKASWQNATTNNSVFKIESVANGSFTNNTGGVGTKITFYTEVYDYANAQSNSSYAIPASGVYHFDAKFNFGVTNTQSNLFYNFFLVLVKNGTTTLESTSLVCTHNPYNDDYTISISTDQLLNAGDVITIHFRTDVDYVTDPGSVLIQSGSLSGFKVR